MANILAPLCAAALLLTTQAVGQGFTSTAITWTNPVGGYLDRSGGDVGFYIPASALSYSTSTLTGSQNWATVDLNGDNALDLVVTGERASSGYYSSFGTSANRYWKVYLGSQSGFATTPLTWSVPTGGSVSAGFFSTDDQNAAAGQTGSQNWTTTDLNGDGKPDLVVTSERVSNQLVYPFGTAPARYWLVYLNTGSGFAATAVNWDVPAGGDLPRYAITKGFWATSSENASGGLMGSQNWATLDMNGDRKPDLVVTSQQDNTETVFPFGDAAGRYWNVYLNVGNGFAATATVWAIPAGGPIHYSTTYTSNGFYALTGLDAASGKAGSQNWTTMDLTGDGKPDLVVTSELAASGVTSPFGTATNRYWKVYAGGPNGFAATAMTWTNPVGGYAISTATKSGFYLPTSANPIVSVPRSQDKAVTGSQNWTTMDLTGDGKPDLVVTSELAASGVTSPFGTATNRYWKVYAGGPNGFAATAMTWTNPVGGFVASSASPYSEFYVTTSAFAAYGGAGTQDWTTTDMSGDGVPDLVVSSELGPGTFGTAPNRYWKVYLSDNRPLATAAPASLAAGVRLYPNPAAGQLMLSGPASLAGQPYALLDVLGRPLRTGQLGAAEPTLDVQALPAGVYGVRLGTDNHLLRFVKQ